jgi:hypothetical protein
MLMDIENAWATEMVQKRDAKSQLDKLKVVKRAPL